MTRIKSDMANSRIYYMHLFYPRYILIEKLSSSDQTGLYLTKFLLPRRYEKSFRKMYLKLAIIVVFATQGGQLKILFSARMRNRFSTRKSTFGHFFRSIPVLAMFVS